MKSLVIVLGSSILVTALSGCAHLHKVESLSQPEGGVKVGIGSSEVNEGERVTVFIPICKDVLRKGGDSRSSCENKKVGEAVVLKVLSKDSAIVKPDAGLVMSENMRVEKQK